MVKVTDERKKTNLVQAVKIHAFPLYLGGVTENYFR